METKTFKDYIPAAKEVKKPIAKKIIMDKPVVVEKKEQKQEKTFVTEVFTADVRREVYENEKGFLSETLTKQITETIKKEYDSKIAETTTILQEQMNNSVLEMMKANETTFLKLAESLVESTAKLCEKIDELQSSLNITVPTPIVQFTMPERNVVKKVHRDKKGNITHVTESNEPTDSE